VKLYLKEPITIPFALNDTSTGVSIKIMRLSDGYWLDFNDMTFKNSGWTADSSAMTADSNNVWKYSWTAPQLEDKYQIIFINQETGFSYSGPLLEVIGNIYITIQSDAGNGISTFKTDLTESTTDFFQSPSLIKFITGNNTSIVKKIPATGSFNGTTKFLTITGTLPFIPQAGDKAILIIS